LKTYNTDGTTLLSREEVLGSPYDITVYPDTPSASSCVVYSGWASKDDVDGAGTTNSIYKFSANTGNIRTFYVSARDNQSNDWWTGGANFVGRVRGETNESTLNKRLSISDMSNGRYKVDVLLDVAGDYEIDIMLANNNDANVVLNENGVKNGGGLLGSYVASERTDCAESEAFCYRSCV